MIYALVIREPKVVLAEYTGLTGNFQQATMLILQKLDGSDEWKSYTLGEYAFHYIIDRTSGLWFVCMADGLMGRRMPFGFLTALKEEFKKRYTPEEIQCAIAYGMRAEFDGQIQVLMDKYNDPREDRVQHLLQTVHEITDDVMESIDQILGRQEKIELLVNRSQSLAISSSSFRREAVQVRNVIWWQNTKIKLLLAFLAIFFIILIAFASCGITFSHC